MNVYEGIKTLSKEGRVTFSKSMLGVIEEILDGLNVDYCLEETNGEIESDADEIIIIMC